MKEIILMEMPNMSSQLIEAMGPEHFPILLGQLLQMIGEKEKNNFLDQDFMKNLQISVHMEMRNTIRP